MYWKEQYQYSLNLYVHNINTHLLIYIFTHTHAFHQCFPQYSGPSVSKRHPSIPGTPADLCRSVRPEKVPVKRLLLRPREAMCYFLHLRKRARVF